MKPLDGRMDLDEIRARIAAKGLSQTKVGEALGLDQPKVSRLLKGQRQIKHQEMEILRDLLRADGDHREARAIPIIGQVAASRWRQAIQHPAGYMPQPDPSIPGRAFALRVAGDSMDRYVEDGGTVIIDPDDKALYPGRFYVISDGDGETTFKRFAADPARLEPCSTNPIHEDILLGSGEQFEVVGRVIWRGARM